MPDLDELDRTILNILQREGRISNADLARRVNMSSAATYTRLKRLEQDGYIDGYVARLNRAKLGYTMVCYVNLSLQTHQSDDLQRFRERLIAIPEVLECCFITGEFDYLLKVALRDQSDLEEFILKKLTPLPGVARVCTSLVVAELKSTTALPIRANDVR